ncbi:MAG: hypothetical protein A3K19_33780 [Lentisphaerae bacterium RIFOXYB12_FULL_65_16]|nr:MAG: hypothetical protein A3K19_30385 [Lentisphaerae bacterium RIFOXYB12_FULL_65_16]OGV95404.1 MAG: hypothetical protein A3K19_33780 [Lentisphaerae bacterium RIFOXYB12_FULL_65_16]
MSGLSGKGSREPRRRFRARGLYAWADSRNGILAAVQATCDVAIVRQQEFGSHRSLLLARLTPRHAVVCAPDLKLLPTASSALDPVVGPTHLSR